MQSGVKAGIHYTTFAQISADFWRVSTCSDVFRKPELGNASCQILQTQVAHTLIGTDFRLRLHPVGGDQTCLHFRTCTVFFFHLFLSKAMQVA